jgi:hypothetical protein
MHRLAVLALVAAGALAAPAQDAAAPGQPLKVRKLVVYKHGVGYFEREGKVSGTQQVALSFKTAQMKDLLKSLYAVDLNGGQIATIQYDTKDPLSKQLEDILIHVPEERTLTQFLTQLKGARVEATISGEKVTGNVVGIEPVSKATPQGGTTQSYKLVLYADGGRILPVDLLEAQSLRLLDDGLQRDLQRVLDIHLKSKYADRKSVALNCSGQGDRTVRVGYIIETPIWKTSYRLLFEEGRQPLLQGWAILENTTDEDWEQVEASFVAGSPMSFVMDLYTAYYPQRSEIPVGVTAAPRPSMNALAEKAATARPMAPPAAAAPGRSFDRREAGKKDGAAEELLFGAEAKGGMLRKSFAEALEHSVAPAAAGVEVGDLFAYQARERVSVKRGQAALVPILSERVDGAERVLYYKASVMPKPMNSVYFKNSTPLTLEAGPVTLFDGSTCIGEGLVRKVLKKDMKDMIPYAVEAGVSVDHKVVNRNDPVTRGVVVGGALTLTYVQNLESAYVVKSQLGKDSVVYLDHPRAPNHQLSEPAKAEDEADDHYRFRLEVKAGETKEFKIRERQEVRTQVSLLGTPADTIRFYLSQRYLSDKAKLLLEQLLAAQAEISRLRQEESTLATERTRLSEDQSRIRQNVSILRDTAGELEMRRKYLARLEQAETRLERIAEELRKAQGSREELEKDLSKRVRDFREE